MIREKNRATPSKKKNRASTRPAMLEAGSGNKGNPPIVSARPARRLSFGVRFPPPENKNEKAQPQDRENPAKPHEADHQAAVFAGGGVVVVAKQQQTVHGRADLVG